MAINKTLLNEASQHLQPGAVTLKKANFEHTKDFGSIPEDQHIIQGYNYTKDFQSFDLSDSDNSLYGHIFTYEVSLRVINKDDEAEEKPLALATITAVFEVAYESPAPLSEKCLQEFARVNVGYHAWPYWREFVQNSCTRMGLPVIGISTYKIPQN